MSKLIRWDTPFATKYLPSVVLAISGKSNNTYSALSAIVAPQGLDKYPKYKVNFENVIAFVCMEEAFSPRNFVEIAKEENGLCTYQWVESPWLESYNTYNAAMGKTGPLLHYLIFGGDNNVEVITQNIPGIEKIEKKTSIEIRYEF